MRFVSMVHTTRAECVSQWRSVYYTGLVLRHTPLVICLFVMVSHYVSCDNIMTPFHGLLSRAAEPIILPTATSIPTTDVMLDPVSLLYDAFMAMDKPETPEVVPEEVHIPQIDHHVGVIQICVMHAISLGSFMALWLPTTYSHFAAKSSGMWTIASIAIGCCSASWMVCMLVYSCCKLRQLSLCLAMHLAMHLLHAQGFLAEQDPSVPIYMPVWVARGVNVAQVGTFNPRKMVLVPF
jgi:hypothetical protein